MVSLLNVIGKIDLFIELIDEFKELLGIQKFQFLIDNHWENENILNSKLRHDLDELAKECDKNNQVPNLLKIYMLETENRMLKNLSELFDKLKKLNKLWNEEILTPVDNLFDLNNKQLENFEKKFLLKFSQIGKQNRFMNEKKTYEVDLMSKFVAKLCKSQDIKTVSAAMLQNY